jgi:hypothetical protein
MSIQKQAYWYNDQLKRYITQFMAIFSGLQVQVGRNADLNTPSLVPATIHYGSHDRVVAALMADNTQNKPLRLPMMTAYMENLELAQDLMHGTGTERRSSYVPTGGLLPNDVEVVHQRAPVPYRMTVQLGIYASNTDQHFQILEQILMLFEPQLMIQTSDSVFDLTRLTTVKLMSLSMDQQHPIGTDRRIIQSTVRFEMPVYLASPADVRKDFIKTIKLRIGMVDNAITQSGDIVSALDDLGIVYEEWANGADVGFQ